MAGTSKILQQLYAVVYSEVGKTRFKYSLIQNVEKKLWQGDSRSHGKVTHWKSKAPLSQANAMLKASAMFTVWG